jgi:hypothetical protein
MILVAVVAVLYLLVGPSMVDRANVMTKTKWVKVVFQVWFGCWAETVINKAYVVLGVF